MIGYISGNLLHSSNDHVLIDVHGVGYKVFVTETVRLSLPIGEKASLWTYLAVREQALDLFGFEYEEERIFFELLIGVSGIGPRSALGIIGLAPIATLRKAIAQDDISYLTKVSGIGKKTAEKIVIELRDKIEDVPSDKEDASLRTSSDALEALIALGYSQKDARATLHQISTDEHSTTEDQVRHALHILNNS